MTFDTLKFSIPLISLSDEQFLNIFIIDAFISLKSKPDKSRYSKDEQPLNILLTPVSLPVV